MFSQDESEAPAGMTLAEEFFEPYAFRHIAVFVKRGKLVLNSVGCRTFERNKNSAIKRTFKKESHNEIYASALRTFAHNAVDLFTDCPSRERAGWLCDSFFTGRAEFFLYGETPIEDAFLENFVLFNDDGAYPDGVLPMCYPSDPHDDNKFIPQWNIWYVLEVCEYLNERRPDADKEIFRPSVMGVVNFLQKYENSDGLLERLPSWNFVEWSAANTWVYDVNYPTNFLYSAMLEAVAKTFGYKELLAKVDNIRIQTVKKSFNGEFFVDHAVKNADGEYINEKHISEACQYYAVLFGGIDLNRHQYSVLKANIINDFEKIDAKDYSFCRRNAFIGLYLRINTLMNMNEGQALSKTINTFCYQMCRITGTLWEYKDGIGSLDHGFASYVALALPIADEFLDE